MRILAVASFLVLLRVPFFAARHIQEDAFITWRCARNLCETGVYGFNLGERVSASTSHAYVALSALVYALAQESLPTVMQIINSGMLVGAILLLARSVSTSDREVIPLWIGTAVAPVALLASYSGMETSALLLAIAGSFLWLGNSDRFRWGLFALFLLPWIRPEAVAFGGLVSVAASARGLRRLAVGLMATAVGLASVLMFNVVYFGQLLHQTVVAKSAAMSGGFAVARMVERLGWVFGGPHAFLLPLQTKYLAPVAPLLALLMMGLVACGVVEGLRMPRGRTERLCAAGLSVIVPAAYAISGALFSWYFWPSAILAWLLILQRVIRGMFALRAPLLRLAGMCAALTAIILASGQLAIAVNWGCQEWGYRRAIGEDLAGLAHRGDTLLLEPAGYIPYYSRLYTYDEVGITSPSVTQYRRTFGVAWWPRFVRDRRPTYLVEREHIIEGRTLDGFSLTQDDRRWFMANYELLRSYTYSPFEVCAKQPRLLPVLRLGSTADYFLYRYRGAAQ